MPHGGCVIWHDTFITIIFIAAVLGQASVVYVVKVSILFFNLSDHFPDHTFLPPDILSDVFLHNQIFSIIFMTCLLHDLPPPWPDILHNLHNLPPP